MCLVWTVKYNICGCICEKESIYCTAYQLCWGPRAIIFHSNLQTCKECWKRGDKRVNVRLAKILTSLADEERERNPRRGERSRSRHRTSEDGRTAEANENSSGRRSGRQSAEGARTGCDDADIDAEQDIKVNVGRGESEDSRHEAAGRNEDHGGKSPNPSSRPNTPIRDLNLDPDYIPPWLLSIEQNCDLTRVCDPVRNSSFTRNNRATRRRTDWYALEDVLGVYLGPGAEREIDDEQVMEGFMRICEEAGISWGLLQAWIELEMAAM